MIYLVMGYRDYYASPSYDRVEKVDTRADVMKLVRAWSEIEENILVMEVGSGRTVKRYSMPTKQHPNVEFWEECEPR